MATRFYLTNTSASASPTVDAGWEITDVNFVRRLMRTKSQLPFFLALNDGSATVPITTTQDIVRYQFISQALRPQTISGTLSLVIRCSENATTNNAFLAVVAKVFSADGTTARGTLFSNYNQDTEYPITASAATRIVNAQAVSAIAAQDGDIIVVEIGSHAAAPTAAGSFIQRFGNNAASDFALTSGLTTDLNPWIEFSADIQFQNALPNNHQSVRAGNGISVNERIK